MEKMLSSTVYRGTQKDRRHSLPPPPTPWEKAAMVSTVTNFTVTVYLRRLQDHFAKIHQTGGRHWFRKSRVWDHESRFVYGDFSVFYSWLCNTHVLLTTEKQGKENSQIIIRVKALITTVFRPTFIFTTDAIKTIFSKQVGPYFYCAV